MFKRPKFEENSREQNLAILGLLGPPEPEPVKRPAGSSSSPLRLQVHESNLSNETGSPPQTPLILSGANPQSTKTKVNDNEKAG